MRAIGYVRVSTEGQATDGVSLDAQQARIAAWCTANETVMAGVYVDAGISGGRADNRPGLQKALDDVCQADGVLVVYSLSRLARSVLDTITITNRLHKAGADLVSLSEKIDTTSAAGKMIFRVMAVMAEFEKDLISERTKTAMSYKRSKGERVGSIPLGFVLDADGKTLVEAPDEMATVATIRELDADGLGLRSIARELDRRGIATKTGRAGWSHTAVAKILARPPAPDSITTMHAPSKPQPHLFTPGLFRPGLFTPGSHHANQDASPTGPTPDAGHVQ